MNPIPKDYSTATPMIMVDGNLQATLDFLANAFDATIIQQVNGSNGQPWHVSIKIGDSSIMMGDTMGMHPASTATMYIYLKDVDAAFEKATKAGGKTVMEPKDQFYGDRSGAVKDPAGNTWWVATLVEKLSDEEIQKRALEEEKKMKSQSQKKAA